MPVLRVDLPATIRTLHEVHRVLPFAAVIDHGARLLDDITPASLGDRWCAVVGSEDDGISEGVREACGPDQRVRIWMRDDVDYLNIGVAAAVLLNGLRERE